MCDNDSNSKAGGKSERGSTFKNCANGFVHIIYCLKTACKSRVRFAELTDPEVQRWLWSICALTVTTGSI